MNRTRLDKKPQWKGDEASYSSKHSRVRNLYGRPKKCELCSRPNRTEGRSIIQYANISGLFLIEREDWKFLCPSCHKKFDYKPETGLKISLLKKGKKIQMTPKSLQARKTNSIKKQKMVVATNDSCSRVYKSIKEAATYHMVGKGNIVRACKEPHRICGGFRWRYYDINNEPLTLT